VNSSLWDAQYELNKKKFFKHYCEHSGTNLESPNDLKLPQLFKKDDKYI
jgi:hypothetical protein